MVKKETILTLGPKVFFKLALTALRYIAVYVRLLFSGI